jgi:hypothetical protein
MHLYLRLSGLLLLALAAYPAGAQTHSPGYVDPRPVLDTEVDLVTGTPKEVHPIAPEQLRVFPEDSDLPKDAVNGQIDREFVPMAKFAM